MGGGSLTIACFHYSRRVEGCHVIVLSDTCPPFYLTKFCAAALNHISRHHEDFYSNIENINGLPNLQPYEPQTIKKIQQMADTQFPEFMSALNTLASEDTTLLHEASQHHQNLSRIYLDSFPQTFHRIQLHGYIWKALEDRKHTLE